MTPLFTDRLTLISTALTLASFYFFVRFSLRRHRDRQVTLNPGMRKKELGRYSGRFFASGIFTVLFGLLLALSCHLRTWHSFDDTVLLGKVVAHGEGESIKLDLDLPPMPAQTVTVQGRFWILRADMLVFDPRWRVIGLKNYVRIRSVDGLAKREERIAGGSFSHVDLAGASPVFQLFSRLPAMPWLCTAKSDASPLKPPQGEVEIHLIAGGFAG